MPCMKTLYFATHNGHKLDEARKILGGKVLVRGLGELQDSSDIPETADTLDGNALIKARYVWETYHVDCFADDTGLEVEALDGRPGVYTARFAAKNNFVCDMSANNEANNRRYLLSLLDGQQNRKARFRTAVAAFVGGTLYTCEGIVNGTIALQESGDGGFGYDSLFIPEGYDRTFAELPPEVKNAISHRARALQTMLALPPFKS